MLPNMSNQVNGTTSQSTKNPLVIDGVVYPIEVLEGDIILSKDECQQISERAELRLFYQKTAEFLENEYRMKVNQIVSKHRPDLASQGPYIFQFIAPAILRKVATMSAPKEGI